MGVIALVVGELTALLRVDKTNWSRDLNQAEADLNRVGRGAGQAVDSVDTRTGRMVSSVSQSMAKVAREADRQGAAAGGRFGDEFSKRVGTAMKSLPAGEVKLDDAVAQVRIVELRRALESLADKRIGVDLSTNDAVAEVQRIRRELSSLSDETIDVQVKADTRAAIAELDRFFGSTGTRAQASGDDAGGRLAQGMSQAITRNSPLIVAAVAGALAVGAPAMIAGATTLFAGIGIVAAAQSDVVKEAWSGTWDEIKLGTQSAASSLVPVVANMAAKVEESFGRMRPAIQQAFEASGPIIDRFSDSILRAAENALPGLVAAVQSSGPVMEGLGVFLERVGTGLSEFFTIISAHAPAAGAAFAALGDIVGELLPILGEFMGTGVELASIVLPPLASVLGVVADVLGDLGPILPAVVAGFTGLKIINSITSGVETLATKFAGLPGSMTAGGVAAAGLAVGLAVVATEMAHAQRNADDMARSMIEGGDASRNSFEAAQSSIAGMNAGWVDGASQMMEYVGQIPIVGQASEAMFDLISTTSDEAAAKAEESFNRMLAAMTPLQRSQAEVAHWQNEIARATGDSSYVIEDMHGNVVTLSGAEDALVQAQMAAAAAAEAQADALGGTVTTLEEAVEAADNLSSALDSLNGGQLDLNDAQRAFADTVADAYEQLDKAREGAEGYALTLDQSTQAGRDNAAALDDIARAGNDAADAYYRQTGDYAGFRTSMEASRQTLIDTAMQFGMNAQEAQAYADTVLAIPDQQDLDITTNANQAALEVQGVEQALANVPNGHEINVGVISENAKSILADLGYTVTTLPNGEVVVTANDGATPILDSVYADALGLSGTTAGPTLTADRAPFDSIMGAAQAVAADFGGQIIMPTADLNNTPLLSNYSNAMVAVVDLDSQTPTPVADLNPAPFNSGISAATQDALTFGGLVPTPTANLNAGPFNSIHGAAMSAVQALAGQTPTPTASMNAAPLFGTQSAALGAVWNLGGQVAHPAAYLNDGVTGPARAAAAAIYAIPNRTVYVSVVTTGVSAAQNIVSAIGRAEGGPVYAAAVGRKVIGPGGPTDDLVSAVGPGGSNWALSNGEWVIRAEASAKYGDLKMSAVNAGTADIVLPSERPRVRAMAGGGSVSELGGSTLTDRRVFGDVHFHLNGTVDFADGRSLRRAAEKLHAEFLDIERARS